MRRTKEEALETRSRILHAALDIFCEKPYARVSIMEIAEAVNMSKGAVYWHFKSKDDLFIQLMNSVHETIKENFPSQVGEVNTLKDLRAYYKLLIAGPKDTELYVKVRKLLLRMNEWPQKVCIALWDFRKAGYEREKLFVSEVLKKELQSGNVNINVNSDPEAIAEAIVAIFNGIGNLRFMEMLTKDFAKHVDFIFNALERELKEGNFPPKG